MRIFLVMLLFPMLAFGADLKDLPEARSLLDSVMSSVAKDDIRGAFAKLKPYWNGLPNAEVEVLVSKIIDQRGQVAARFGQFR